MTVADMYSALGRMLTGYDWMPANAKWMSDHLIGNSFADGSSYEARWKHNLRVIIESIAAEPTWLLQRTTLLRFRVNANSWLAARDAVLPELKDDVNLWKEIVNHSDTFTNNDMSKWACIIET